jgi:hypothetical protein
LLCFVCFIVSQASADLARQLLQYAPTKRGTAGLALRHACFVTRPLQTHYSDLGKIIRSTLPQPKPRPVGAGKKGEGKDDSKEANAGQGSNTGVLGGGVSYRFGPGRSARFSRPAFKFDQPFNIDGVLDNNN